MESLKILDGISSEKFIMRFIYGFAAIFKAYGDRFPTEDAVVNDSLMQVNTQGCLFDFCQNKKDIKKFFKAPKLSIEAETVLNQKQLPTDFITQLKKEIQLLKPGFMSKMKALMANNMLISTIISFLLGLISNIISNLITK